MFDHEIYLIEYYDPEGGRVRTQIFGGPKYQSVPSKTVSGRVYLEYPEVEHIRTPIRASGLRIELQANEQTDYLELWTEQEREFGVIMTIDGVRYFYGYIKPDGVFQDWTRTNYNITIDAIDGLGFLEDLAYVDSNGLNFTGLQKPIKIISNCLLRFGNALRILTLPNIGYVGQTAGVDVLNDTYMKVDRYYRDLDTIASCKEVLESVLSTFGMCICLNERGFFVYDPELIARGENNTYFDYFANGDPAGTYSVSQFRSIGSHIDNYNLFHINFNQRLEMRASISGVRVNYKYGLDESLLDNEFLTHNGVSYAGWTINDATRHTFGANNAGAYIGHGQTSLVMTADGITVAQDDNITLNFIVENKFTPLADRGFAWRARIGNNNYVKFSPGLGTWQSNAVTNVNFLAPNQRLALSVPLDAVPTSGNLIIELYGFQFDSTTQGSLQIVAVQATPDSPNATRAEGENHTVQISGSSVADDPIEVQNGDNESDLYYGTIYKPDQVTPTSLWGRINAGEQEPILKLLAEKVVRMNQKPAKYFSGDVYNLLGYLYNFSINNIEGNFIIMGYTYDTYMRIASFVVRQIYDDELVDATYELTYDYGNTIKPTIVG